MRKLNLILLGLLGLTLAACSTPQPTKGFDLPPALREVYRGGQLKPMQEATDGDLGLQDPLRRPTNYDLVQHTCVSKPIFDLYGNYLRTDTLCW